MMQKPSVDEITANWLEQPKMLAKELVDKYGEPDEISTNMMTWYNKGPWKRTILRNEELPHEFPKPHKDSLESIIDYHVPPEKADELAEFDGSLLFDRTKGEMSGRCDREEANFLAVNLAHEIITGKRTVEEAREEYGRQIKAMMEGNPGPYMKELQFELQKGGTNDPDHSIIKAA